MQAKKFAEVSARKKSPKWPILIGREDSLYPREGDIRSEFARDYNRILHSTAYRRLKHKTQVFFATKNDHICTRIEHVNHVAAVSQTIANELGLNVELVNAIAIGHDLGHAPFGHEGEKVLAGIADDKIGATFWHERNGLRFVDRLETLPGPDGLAHNLRLTYATRDGIVSHCGEVDEKALFPREEEIDLKDINQPSEYPPYTWEGCVVKVADKVAFLGRDLEDARQLGLIDLGSTEVGRLVEIASEATGRVLDETSINTTVLMHHFILNLCRTSSPDLGLRFSDEFLQLMRAMKDFSDPFIYRHPRLDYFKRYAKLIIESIFECLKGCYKGHDTLAEIKHTGSSSLEKTFSDWLIKYSDGDLLEKRRRGYGNDVVYGLDSEHDYARSCMQTRARAGWPRPSAWPGSWRRASRSGSPPDGSASSG